MNKSEPVDPQYFYRELWLRAKRSDVEIEYKTKRQAQSMRLHLYRFLKPFRDDPFLDPELTECAELMSVAVSDRTMTISRKLEHDLIQFTANQLDMAVQDPKLAADLDAMAARMMKLQTEVKSDE